MDAAIVLARIVQYLGGAALFGAPLFLLYALPSAAARRLAWPRPLIASAALAALGGAFAYLAAQTAMMADDPAAATDPETLQAVLTGSALGAAVAARIAAAGVALVVGLAAPPGRAAWTVLAGLGAVVLLSFAWTGHGAAQDGVGGAVHLAADLLHLLAAGVWVGALVAFALLLARPGAASGPAAEALHRSLAGFAGVGSAAVAAVVATGLVNSWFLVGPEGLGRLFTSPYGRLLLVKLLSFGGMVLLAARNRFVHTRALGRALAGGLEAPPWRALRRSIAWETALGVAVLALVGALGMLEPVAAQ